MLLLTARAQFLTTNGAEHTKLRQEISCRYFVKIGADVYEVVLHAAATTTIPRNHAPHCAGSTLAARRGGDIHDIVLWHTFCAQFQRSIVAHAN